MQKPTKQQFGYTRLGHWINGDQDGYYEALKAWENRQQSATPGRQRKREIHESWQPYLALFDSSTTTRSQGAFCRASGVNRATLSGAMCKQITVKMEEKISIWIEELKKKQNEI